jgi:hypothetical protein
VPSAGGEPAERAVSEVERLAAGYSLALSAARKVGIVEFGQSEAYSSGVAQMLSTILLIVLILILAPERRFSARDSAAIRAVHP